jgi:GNAT superfamily N-acetyltransferase
MSRMPAFQIRPVRPDELPTMLEIDDDAGALFAAHGVHVSLADDHPFVRAERRLFRAASGRGEAFFAVDEARRAVGLLVLGTRDGAPYVEQLAVRIEAMRRGIGARLLQKAIAWADARAGELWLTTYAHLPFNAPYYARFGFASVPESVCGPHMKDTLRTQREALPHPEERVAMVRRRC